MRSLPWVPGIRFNDSYFLEPERLSSWLTPRFAGLFVILSGDPLWSPKSFRPLCFGEFGNDSPHPLAQCGCTWMLNAASVHQNLYIAVLPMPFSTGRDRSVLQQELIAAYNPVLQQRAQGRSGELLRRIDDLERRFQEQHAQMLALLRNIHQHFEPQPVPPRRPMGFLTGPATESGN